MAKEKLFSNKYADTYYDASMKLFEIIWHSRVVPDEEYKNIYEKSLDQMESREFYTFLSDTRNEGVISPKARKWFQEEAVQRANKMGLRYAAVIINKEIFKKYYMNMILKWLNRKSEITMKIFYDYDEAIEWLKSFL